MNTKTAKFVLAASVVLTSAVLAVGTPASAGCTTSFWWEGEVDNNTDEWLTVHDWFPEGGQPGDGGACGGDEWIVLRQGKHSKHDNILADVDDYGARNDRFRDHNNKLRETWLVVKLGTANVNCTDLNQNINGKFYAVDCDD